MFLFLSGFSLFWDSLGVCSMESLLIATSFGNFGLVGSKVTVWRLGYGMQFVNGFFTGMYSGKTEVGVVMEFSN